MEINEFKGDALTEENGKWIPFEDAKLLIAASMNPRHKKALARLGKKHQKAIRLGNSEAQESLTIEAMADGVLLGWENLTADGKPFPYTRENAIALLKIRTFLEFVSSESQNLRNFQNEVEDGAKADLKSGPIVDAQVG